MKFLVSKGVLMEENDDAAAAEAALAEVSYVDHVALHVRLHLHIL